MNPGVRREVLSRRILRNLALAVAFGAGLFVLGAAPARADNAPDPAKQADIVRLMKLTGAGNIGLQAMDQMIISLKGAMTNVPEKFWTEFRKEVNADELVNLIIPVYDKHLSHAEVKELIRFYETPVGKKMISVMPAITQESMQVGQQWGMGVAMRAKQKLESQTKK
jgi:hypothetical protein